MKRLHLFTWYRSGIIFVLLLPVFLMNCSPGEKVKDLKNSGDIAALKKRAELGKADAQFNLGLIYYRGEGVTQDYAEAVRWYRMAAEQGFAEAQGWIGYMYHEGQGVTQDHAEAVKWYRMAAEQGYTPVQYFLGEMYYSGEGVPQNYAESYFWFFLASSGWNKLGEQAESARKGRDLAGRNLSAEEISTIQKRAVEFYSRLNED